MIELLAIYGRKGNNLTLHIKLTKDITGYIHVKIYELRLYN